MKKQITQTAFILAAGKGTRLRPYTDTLPKPMVSIAGKPIIDHLVGKLKEIEIKNVIINLFYLGDSIKDYFKNTKQPYLIFSDEDEILETGGGVKNALHHIKDDVFFLINGDAFWVDSDEESVLSTLNNQWNPEKMDILLLLQPVSEMKLTKGIGDYNISDNGRAVRSHDQSGDYMFAGVRLTKKSVFENTPNTPFSFLKLMDEAEKKGKLFGVVHQGDWHHISTANDLKAVNESLGYETPAPIKQGI